MAEPATMSHEEPGSAVLHCDVDREERATPYRRDQDEGDLLPGKERPGTNVQHNAPPYGAE